MASILWPRVIFFTGKFGNLLAVAQHHDAVGAARNLFQFRRNK